MGTKNNPGAFDCYANAEPDEPMFILLGRDKHAPLLARLWALLRHRDGEDEDKVNEACRCATSMEQWQIGLGKHPFHDPPPIVEALLIAATEHMREHPDDYDAACACDECCTYE